MHAADDILGAFEQACRQRGLPMTIQRRAVLEALLGHEDHPTADGVYEEIKARLPNVSRTSVYRILDLLVAIGLVTKVCHPGSAARFDPNLSQHHHLVCVCCERIIDVEDPRLNALPLPDVRAQGFRISDYHVHFRGLCAECLSKKTADAARPVGRPKAGSKIRPAKGKERKRP